MGRPPILAKAMTATERKRRQRAGLSAKQLREKEAERRAKTKARREAQSAALRKAAAERKAKRAAAEAKPIMGADEPQHR